STAPASPPTRTRSRTTRRSRSSRAVCGSARLRSRRRAWRSRRWPRSRSSSPPCCGRPTTTRSRRRSGTRRPASAPSSRPIPTLPRAERRERRLAGYAVVGGTAAVVTFLVTFVMRWLAPRVGAMAMPGARSVHLYPTPVLGGAAMFAGLLAAMGVASQLDQFHEMFDGSSEPIGILVAAGVMFVVGVIDDLREVSPPAKVAGQVLSGGALSLFGVTMLYFRVPFASYDYIVLSPDLAALVTILAVVALANAMNLIDGLDGLATGIALIAGLALFLYADRLFKAGLIEGSNIGSLVAIIIAGVCAGFLPHNFNPARIFMGDA